MTAFNPLITDAGRAAAINAENDGLQLQITHIGFDKGAFSPSGTETAAVDEAVRLPVAGTVRVNSTTFQLLASGKAPVGQESWIGAVNFWAGDVLFAVLSRASGNYFYFSSENISTVDFSLSITSLPADSITVLVDETASATLALIAEYRQEIIDFRNQLGVISEMPVNGQLEVNKTYMLAAGSTGTKMPQTFVDGDKVTIIRDGDMETLPADLEFFQSYQGIPAGVHQYNKNQHTTFYANDGGWL